MTIIRQQLSAAYTEIFSVSSSNSPHVNEDAWLVLENINPPGYFIAAVIDGAGSRLKIPKLEAALHEHFHSITAAAFAAAQVRTSLISQLNTRPGMPLQSALLGANKALREALIEIIGDFSPEHILALADGLSENEDPRRIRLALPACVVTLMRLDYTHQQLDYAHAGDTSLLEIRRDGDVVRHTTDQMGPYDEAVLHQAARLRQIKNLPHIADAVALPEVRRLNIENGLRHNYVDTQGHTNPGDGCGVLDGLPELADYIEMGTLTVDPAHTAGFCLLSDGLELLAPLNETAQQQDDRLRQMGALIKSRGLSGLFEALQQMIMADSHFDQYPRMKMQDDATGVYLQILDRQ